MFGVTMTADEVLDEVERDASFYRTSGGGMTLSGGECLMYPDLPTALLKGAHERGINTAIETAGNVPWRFVEQVLPHVDTVLHDLKLMDEERHKKWTGVSNKRLLENFKKAYETWPDKTFIARRPLIPGVNDDEEDIRAVLEFIRPHKNVDDFELLPYMRFGLGKYHMLGQIYELDDFEPPTEESLQRLQAIIDEAFGRSGEEDPKLIIDFKETWYIYGSKEHVLRLGRSGRNVAQSNKVPWPTPFLGLRGTTWANVPREVAAGITLAAMIIPLNIGFTQVAGLPATAGLYAGIIPLVLFAIFTSSRQVVASPDAPITALLAATLVAFAPVGDPLRLQYALAIALLSGLLFFVFWFFRLAFLANFLSRAVLAGFITGLGIEVFTNQVRRALGVSHAEGGGSGVEALAIADTGRLWAPRVILRKSSP